MFLLLVLSKLYYIICVYVIDIVINPIDVYCISNLISCFKASKDNYLTFVVPLHKIKWQCVVNICMGVTPF